MIFEDGAIIVEKGRIRARHDVETVGRPRMLKIMNNGR